MRLVRAADHRPAVPQPALPRQEIEAPAPALQREDGLGHQSQGEVVAPKQPKPPKRVKTTLDEEHGFGHERRMSKEEIEKTAAEIRADAEDANEQEDSR